ncbi:MAG: hypothetical protein IT560_14015 [Alphaproteobacteria bacterium]|nr:hypothetical protein [Alphaproteobacteria bacterium]
MTIPDPNGSLYEKMMAASDNYGNNVCSCDKAAEKETGRKYDNVWADWRR